ncbi:IstB domain protein ATP-binding protein [Actinobacteria bacterium OV450]|nr:IstB domain protein ATP-binding protein [Actinobacteria bacterium OV450]
MEKAGCQAVLLRLEAAVAAHGAQRQQKKAATTGGITVETRARFGYSAVSARPTTGASADSPCTSPVTFPRQRGLTEQAATAAADQACRMLRLPTIRSKFPELAATAEREQMSYLGFLSELLLAECDDRGRRRSERRIKAAGFPRDKSLRKFDFDANPNIDAAMIHTLAKCERIKKSLPLCLIGDSGTGKSHLLIALGTEAAMAGYRVKYVLATKLVNKLVEAADEKQLTKTIARYGRVDLLCIDELGYMELDRRGAELLFQVLTEREEKNSVAIASNESFSGWTKTFTDPRLCAAIVDRLTFGGDIIETGSDSYRLATPGPALSSRPPAERRETTRPSVLHESPAPIPASAERGCQHEVRAEGDGPAVELSVQPGNEPAEVCPSTTGQPQQHVFQTVSSHQRITAVAADHRIWQHAPRLP